MTNLKLASLVIGTSLMELHEVNSTNLYASNLLKHTNPIEGTIVFTLNQTAGRGQLDSRWESEKGKNITLSTLLYPKWLEPEKQFHLNRAISLGVLDFLKMYAENALIKWPNDLMVNNQKIGGILLESTLNGNQFKSIVAGVGINVNQTEFPDDIKDAVSLKLLTSETHDVRGCIKRLARCMDARYLQLRARNFSLLEEEYLANLYRIDEAAQYSAGSETFDGTIRGVNDQGKLQVEVGGEVREFANKEIAFL